MYVCKDCGHPAGLTDRCPACGGQLVWKDAITLADAMALAQAREKAEEVEANDPLNQAIIDLPDVTLTESGPRLTISSLELIRARFQSRLNEYDIVRVNGVLLEILGYSYTGRLYVARPFEAKTPDTFPKSWLPRRRKQKEA